jgi:hypothetical protein
MEDNTGATTVSFIAFVVIFSGAMFGMYLGRALPLTPETKDSIKDALTLIVTMAALVLGLLVASAKGHYDQEVDGLTQLSANLISLDRVLANYGPEAKEARTLLREIGVGALARISPQQDAQALQSAAQPRPAEQLQTKIQELTPKDDAQRVSKSEALRLIFSIGSTRWLMYLQRTTATPLILVFVLIFWLTIIFIRLGMLAPFNAIVVASLFVAAASVAAAILLIMRVYAPYEGMLQLPLAPLKAALEQIGR